jgi:CRISPR/Cas system-associated endonuclease Cas3-HD
VGLLHSAGFCGKPEIMHALIENIQMILNVIYRLYIMLTGWALLQHSAGFCGKPEIIHALIENIQMILNVIYKLYNMLTGWALLQTYQDRGRIEEGVDKLKMVIREAYVRSHGWAPAVLRIAAS